MKKVLKKKHVRIRIHLFIYLFIQYFKRVTYEGRGSDLHPLENHKLNRFQ